MAAEQVFNANTLPLKGLLLDANQLPLPAQSHPINQVISTGQPLNRYVVGVKSGKDVIWLHVDAQPYVLTHETHSTKAVMLSFFDLSASEDPSLYQQIVTSATDVVVVTKAEPISGSGPEIVYVNQAFERLTGYTREEAIGNTPRMLQGPDTDSRTRQRIKKALTEKTSCRETILNYSKSGQPYWLEMNIMPLKDAQGRVVYFAAIERDVTDQLQRGQQIVVMPEPAALIREELHKVVIEKKEELESVDEQVRLSEELSALSDIPKKRTMKRVVRGLFCGLMTLTLVIAFFNFRSNQETIRSATEQEGLKLMTSLEVYVDNVMSSVFRLAKRAAYHQENYFSEWREDALSYVNHYDGLDTLLYVETTGQVRWFVNELGALPATAVNDSVADFVGTKTTVDSRQSPQKSFEVIKTEAGYTVFFRSPIYKFSAQNFEPKRGYIVGLMNLKQWINIHLSRLSEFAGQHDIALMISGKDILVSGKPGTEAWFPLTSLLTGDLMGLPYQLRITKTRAGVESLGVFNTLYIIAGGLIVSLLSAYSLNAYYRRKVHEAVEFSTNNLLIRHLTNEMQLKGRLLQANNKAKAVIDSILDVVITIDETGKISRIQL